MVKEFLKMAGVKTEAQFYKKYPSEEAFFRAHPQAQQLVHQKMSHGGGIYAYPDGGEPISSDYNNSKDFLAAHAAWEASQGIPQVDQSVYQVPSVGADGIPEYLRAPIIGPPVNTYNPVTTVATAPVAQKNFALKGNYQGPSVWDFLTEQGKAGDYQSRKALAQILGIPNYRGLPEQNALMIELIRQNPDVLSNYADMSAQMQAPTPVISKKSSAPASGFKVAPQHVSLRDEFVNAPNSYDSGVFSKPGMVQDENGNWIWPAAALAVGTGASMYGLGKFAGPGTLQAAQYASDLSKANLTADQIIAYAKKFGKDSETWQLLKARGMKDFEISKALKGIKFKTAVTEAPTEVIKTTQQLLDKFGKVSDLEAKNLENAKRIIQVLKDKKLPRTEEVVAKIAELVPNPATRMQLLKGVGFPETTSAIAKAEAIANAASKVKNVKNAANVAATAGKVANIAKEESLLSKIPLIGKLFREGGAYANVPQHGQPQGPDDGTYYQGGYFQAGGSYNPTSVDYGDALPQFAMGYDVPTAMYGMGMKTGGTPCYNCGGMYEDGGSPLYSTQGQTLRNFTNTLANSSGWSPYHTMLPVVGPNNSGNTSRTPAGLPSLGHRLTIPMNFEDGGLVKGGEYDMSEDEIENLIAQGYKIQYI